MTVQYVIVEGNEGVGKTTFVNMLAHRATQNNVSVITVRNPGGSPTGEALRSILFPQDESLVPSPRVQAMLFMAAMRSALDHTERNIKIQLAEDPCRDILVILDRWIYSCWIYQGAEVDLSMSEAFAFDDIPYGYHFDGIETVPTIALTASYEIARDRLIARSEKLSRFDARPQAEYEAVTEAYRNHIGDEDCVNTDGLTKDQVFNKAAECLIEQGVLKEWLQPA